LNGSSAGCLHYWVIVIKLAIRMWHYIIYALKFYT
jgi:hypothetical protein